jgi:lipoyl(octanoyl) transferase
MNEGGIRLEERVANWVNLGKVGVSEAYQLQEILVRLRKADEIEDTILIAQHHPAITFGADKRNNQFSDELIEGARTIFGEYFSREKLIEFLESNGIEFSEIERGGGATAHALGQFVYYPIVDHVSITGSHELDIRAYKDKIYRVLFESLSRLGVSGIKIADETSLNDREERRDAWIQHNGKSLKMGSKGIQMNGKIASGGFVLYVREEGLDCFRYVKPCGYNPTEVWVTSVEKYLGKKFDDEAVHEAVRGALRKNFGYSGFREINKDVLFGAKKMEVRV